VGQGPRPDRLARLPRPRQARRPVRPRALPHRQGRWRPALGFPSPRVRGERGRKEVGRRGERGGGWVHGLGPCTTASLGCPPKLLLKLRYFSIVLGDFSFFGEIFFYLKLKWSSLGSPLGFSFCENLTMLKKEQELQYQCQCFVPPTLQKMFLLCYVGLLPLRFFPQVPYMPHIMNLKKLRLVHFNKVTQMGVKSC
jgi:hypothetical protein